MHNKLLTLSMLRTACNRANDVSRDSWHSSAYRDLSMSLVKQAHPNYTDAEVATAAQKEFESAALNFFLETLKVCQEVRPNASWGTCA